MVARNGRAGPTFVAWLTFVGAILALIAVGEIPLVQDLSRWIDGSRSILLPATIGLAGLGFVLLVSGMIAVGANSSRPMTEAELDRLAARTRMLGPGQVHSKAWFRGWRRGRAIDPPLEWSFSEMKAAWREGTWWREPAMRGRYLITFGGVALILGGFLLCAVVFDRPAVRLLLLVTVAYAIVRLVVSARRAR